MIILRLIPTISFFEDVQEIIAAFEAIHDKLKVMNTERRISTGF